MNCEHCGQPLTSRFQTRYHPTCYHELREARKQTVLQEKESRRRARREASPTRPRPCVRCGELIENPSRPDQQYHADCYHIVQLGSKRSPKRRQVNVCGKCGASFEVGGRGGRPLKTKFCTSCVPVRKRATPVRLTEIPCAYCQIPFMPKEANQIYHCVACSHAAKRGPHPIKERKVASTYKGGRIQNSEGYMLLRRPGHYNERTRYVLEQRIIMEEFLGRLLEPHETVHHRTNKKDDNRIENLQLRSGKHGKGAAAHCADCGSINIVFDELA